MGIISQLKKEKVPLACFRTGSNLSCNNSIYITSEALARDIPDYKSPCSGKPKIGHPHLVSTIHLSFKSRCNFTRDIVIMLSSTTDYRVEHRSDSKQGFIKTLPIPIKKKVQSKE